MHIEQHLISQEPYFVGGSYRVPAVPYAFHIKAGLLYCCIHQLLNKLIDWLQATVAHTKQHTITDRQYTYSRSQTDPDFEPVEKWLT